MTGKIFLNYRREDSSGHTGRISDRLIAHFGKDNVFFDIDTIPSGKDFVQVIDEAIQSCDVFICTIGRYWLEAKNNDGSRRLENPNDFVRHEIATALQKRIRIIPILVHSARVPTKSELPNEIADIVNLNMIEINDQRFNADTEHLIKEIEEAIKEEEKRRKFRDLYYLDDEIKFLPYKVNQKRVALWGPQHSGKTAYLLSLYIAAHKSGYDWLISLEDTNDGNRYSIDQMADAFYKGTFPNATQINPEPNLYNYVFYPANNSVNLIKDDKDRLKTFWNFMTEEPSKGEQTLHGISLSFADVPGEQYLTEPANNILWRYIAGCHGIICIIDPAEINNQSQVIHRFGGLLKQKIKSERPEFLIDNGRYLPHLLSVCFSKIDKEPWKKFAEDPAGLIEYLENVSGYNIQRMLSAYFSPSRINFPLYIKYRDGF